MSMIPGNAFEKSVFVDGLQVDHLSENTLGHGNRLQGITNPTTYPVLAGDVGERLVGTGATVAVNTSTYVTVASVTVTAGVWDMSTICEVSGVTSLTTFISGIATVSNSATGWVAGDTRNQAACSGTAVNACSVIPTWRTTVTTPTTYYLTAATGGANSTASGRISAVRIA